MFWFLSIVTVCVVGGPWLLYRNYLAGHIFVKCPICSRTQSWELEPVQKSAATKPPQAFLDGFMTNPKWVCKESTRYYSQSENTWVERTEGCGAPLGPQAAMSDKVQALIAARALLDHDAARAKIMLADMKAQHDAFLSALKDIEVKDTTVQIPLVGVSSQS